MGWDEDVFAYLDELEHRAEALHDVERAPELGDRSRAEYAAVTLTSRLMASLDHEVALDVVGVGRVGGRLQRVCAQWCLVHGHGQDWVIPLPAIAAVHGASDRSVPEAAWSPLARLDLASALRRLAEAGEPCVLRLRDGRRHDVVLRRVGRDFVEADEARAPVLVAYREIAAVQSREAGSA